MTSSITWRSLGVVRISVAVRLSRLVVSDLRRSFIIWILITPDNDPAQREVDKDKGRTEGLPPPGEGLGAGEQLRPHNEACVDTAVRYHGRR